MKKMKMRIWCLLLSVAMLLTMLPVMAIAKDDDDKVYDEIEKIIRNTAAEVSMKDANTRSELEDELDGKWLKALKKEMDDMRELIELQREGNAKKPTKNAISVLADVPRRQKATRQSFKACSTSSTRLFPPQLLKV